MQLLNNRTAVPSARPSNASSRRSAVTRPIVKVQAIDEAANAIINNAEGIVTRIASAAPAAASCVGNCLVISGMKIDTTIALGGAVAAAALVAGLAWAAENNKPQAAAEDAPRPARAGTPKPAPLKRENAVLVLGASGRVGRRVVERLIKMGRTVVAATRSTDTAKAALGEAGLVEGAQPGGKGILFYEAADVTSVDSLKRAGLWKGVTQVVLCVGGKAGPLPGGGFGYIDGLTPEVVEAGGIANLVSVLPEVLPKQASLQYTTLVPMGTTDEVAVWERMDDVIMGGNSSSVIELAPELGAGITRWRGELIVEGGGFCGARTKAMADGADLSGYDGVALRVKGDGQIFKINIKTTDQLDSPESVYQATFDTVPGQWTDVTIPWHNFVPVKRAQSDPAGAPLDPSKKAKFGLVLSRFEFNKMPNPAYKPGPFELLIDGGIRAYKAPRAQLVQVSSAGVERNAIIGDDVERRKADIPIVQLNPGATLNHKYAAELAVRASGYPYTVVRSTGMIDSNEGGPFLLEADQGDIISGSISRDEAADVLVAALTSPEAVGKTFEVRRGEALDARGKSMNPAAYTRMFLRLALDRNRWRVGLPPFPKYAPPPAPVTEERTQEILNEVTRVREVQKAAMDAKAGPADVKKEVAAAGKA
uniref:NAD(P)-binding domain-containing protein n=1 Tax=Chlamydomonas leiostraca TaxID=1034604 RepID=A0A7S0RVS8_9CHLO|mmetsp:Transcript_32663/g.82884  ORF Transcript_32663/g.82884 Transcript_32663/m.82884 type:complete len:649 (+) Transcript_32663:46-1992(+)